MNIRKEYDSLAEKGVFIHYGTEFYKDGINKNFSIHFRGLNKKFQTGWHGDNHEFGDIGRVMEKSVMIAKELIELPDVIRDYFLPLKENVTTKGKEIFKNKEKLKV